MKDNQLPESEILVKNQESKEIIKSTKTPL